MSNIVVRPIGYTGATEEIVWTQGNGVSVTAYLWGGGGAGGGSDSAQGGSGSGGGFSLVNFTVNEGDSIKIAVGGSGGTGASGASGYGGGSAGGSFTVDPVFDTRSATTSPPVYPQFNSAWCTFLNTYSIWENPSSATYFDRTWTVNFPVTGDYTFTMSADNLAELYIDGTARFYCDSFTQTFERVFNLSAGSHTIRILAQNTGGPGGVGLTISGGSSYSGGRGGNAGGNGSSGAGGGGGGASVLYLNSTLLAVAGGGGGGGGGGNGPIGQSAPGPNGQATVGISSGQNGTNKNGDGGGGGGGGGGYAGGNGGQSPGGDTGGQGGSYGLSYSSNGSIENPVSTAPAGSGYTYFNSNIGRGGSAGRNGATGSSTLVFVLNGAFVHNGSEFVPVSQTFVKANNIWNRAEVFVKQNGVWSAIRGTFAPIFNIYPGLFGINSREATGDAGDGGGGGGDKIICQKLAEMGFFDTSMNAADQEFGRLLRNQDPDAYTGYLRWAQPVVELLEGKGSATFRKFVFFWVRDEQRRQQMQSGIVAHYLDVIARPWAEEMAYRMQAEGYEKSNTSGRFIMNIGLPMCRTIGRINKVKESPMWIKTVFIWTITTALLISVIVISTTDKLINKLRKFFKRERKNVY